MSSSTRFAVGVHILTVLTAAEPKPVTSELIASSVNTNPVVIRRLLGQLRRHNLVMSRAGIKGGWKLRRSPDSITLLDVYRALGQDEIICLHKDPNLGCRIGAHIEWVLRTECKKIDEAVEATLAQSSIAQVFKTIMSRHRAHRPASANRSAELATPVRRAN